MKFFARPTFDDPHQYLPDFKTIEGYAFGRWRPVAITFWGLATFSSIFTTLILWDAYLSGVDLFIQIHASLMSNVTFGHNDYTFNIPLIEPAAYMCFAVFIGSMLMVLKALFLKTATTTHVHPTEILE